MLRKNEILKETRKVKENKVKETINNDNTLKRKLVTKREKKAKKQRKLLIKGHLNRKKKGEERDNAMRGKCEVKAK